MQRSTGRIITTHVGSLPRPPDLLALIQARANGKPFDEKRLQSLLAAAVAGVVKKQKELGLDVVNDGEFGKPGFIHYVNERLSGFAPSREAAQRNPWAGSREVLSFPEYYESLKQDPHSVALHQERDAALQAPLTRAASKRCIQRQLRSGCSSIPSVDG